MAIKYKYLPAYSSRKEIVKVAVEKHKQELFNIGGVNGVSYGIITGPKSMKYCIDIHLDSVEYASKIPAFLKVKDEKNRVLKLPVRKFISGKAATHSARVGGRIANLANLSNQGTLGYFVTSDSDGEVFILSCYHVLRFDHKWSFFNQHGTEDIVDLSSPSKEVIGKLCFGFRNNRFDIGLARLIPGTEPNISPTFRMNSSVDVFPQDEYRETPVLICGTDPLKPQRAIVFNDEVNKRITYPDGSDQVFEKLMSLTLKPGANLISPTRVGDSGALVCNEKQEAMGIIIGGDLQFSYAMHIRDIEQSLRVKII